MKRTIELIPIRICAPSENRDCADSFPKCAGNCHAVALLPRTYRPSATICAALTQLPRVAHIRQAPVPFYHLRI